MSFENSYSLRKVAEANHKLCDICSARFTTFVLITPDQKDFFYVCSGHLKDTKLCKPKVDPAAVAARREKALQEEVERVKKEYEEKQKKKTKEKEKKGKDKDKDEKKDKDNDEKKNKKKDDNDIAKNKKNEDAKTDDDKKVDEKAESKPDGASSPSSSIEEQPRTFELTLTFYQLRIDTKKRQELAKQQAEMARLNQQRLQDPSFFPSVPKSKP